MTTATTSAPKADDDWLRAAMTDDAVVAELLLRLKQSRASPPAKVVPLLAPPPGWGIRMPRSRPSVSAARCDAYSDSRRKEASDSARRSPTTPLSWSGGSGGGSPSATADGLEESSSGRRASSVDRSKGAGVSETARLLLLTKRSRKKSFAELKDEESLLLEERISLKKVSPIDEISTLRATCGEQRATNESLKKMKLDLNLYSAAKLSTACDEPQKAISGQTQLGVWPTTLHHLSSTLATTTHPTRVDHSQSGYPKLTDKVVSSRDSSFLLPDLNMTPCEDDSGSETLYGMS